MAQITGAISSKDFKIETSVDGAVWEDQSGTAINIDPGDIERAVGSKKTFDGDTAIVTSGKLEPMEIKVEFVYTEGASDLFTDAYNAQFNNTAFYVRWHPRHGESGEFKYTTASGFVSKLSAPPGDSESGDPVVCAFSLTTPGITKGVN